MTRSAISKNVAKSRQSDSRLWNDVWSALEEAEWFTSNDPFKLRDSPDSAAWLDAFTGKIREAREAVLSMQEQEVAS